MVQRRAKQGSGRNPEKTTARVRPTSVNGFEIVEPRWLLRAAAVVVGVALLCGYATFCLLFYQGQWQLVLHPVRTAARPESIGERPYEFLKFGPDGSGLPQRTGWWMPAAQQERYRHLVLLYLPSGDGSLATATATLSALRALGCTVFAVDYRGYGASAPVHLSEATMRADAEAAWRYAVEERHVREDFVLPVGEGVGAALALDLAREHTQTAAVVLDQPRFDVLADVEADRRVKLLPVRWLLHDRFEIAEPLAESRVPKLLFVREERENAKAQKAADPKMTVVIPKANPAEFDRAMRRFLDLYAPPTPAPRLMPSGEPRQEKR